jgi:hypothetical protein
MVHRGNRSKNGKLKQLIRRYIYTTSFQDHILAESVCRVSREDCLAYASGFSVEVVVSDVPDIEKGLILSDSRGRGVFQK